jgi:hypothetical protein
MTPNIYYIVQNTGWTNGVSWFTTLSGTRFSEEKDAMTAALKAQAAMNDPNMKWRLVRNTHYHEENKHTHIEEFINI